MRIKNKNNKINITTWQDEVESYGRITIRETRKSIIVGPSTVVEIYEQIIKTTQIIYERDNFETNHIIDSDNLSIKELKMKYKRFLKK